MNSLHLHKPKQRTKNPKKSEKMYKVKEHGWAEKLAGCLSKQQLSKTAPTKATTAKILHLIRPF